MCNSFLFRGACANSLAGTCLIFFCLEEGVYFLQAHIFLCLLKGDLLSLAGAYLVRLLLRGGVAVSCRYIFLVVV